MDGQGETIDGASTGKSARPREGSHSLKLFLDTADIDEIAEINAWGVLDGVTTNPSLAAREGKDFTSMIKEICVEVAGDVSAEVVSTEADQMVPEARELAGIAPNVVVKIPLIAEGLTAVSRLAREGIRCNVTLCFSPTQAILAAKAGATYVSPFLGRLDDVSTDGMALLRTITEIYRTQGFGTEVLAASLRHPLHVVEAARAGAHVATMPAKVFRQMVEHPLTDRGLDRFLADWATYQQGLQA